MRKWRIFSTKARKRGESAMAMVNPISELGFKSIQLVQRLGQMTTFGGAIVKSLVTPPARIGALVRELYKTGVMSLIVVVCGIAVGMVLGLQGYHTLVRFGAQQSLGALVGLSLIRELGPVLTALIGGGPGGVGDDGGAGDDGRLGATRRPADAVDRSRAAGGGAQGALAMWQAMPMLTAMFILCGWAGGFVVGVGMMGGDAGQYISSVTTSIDFHNDVASSLVKSLVFGVLVGLIATFRGYTSKPTSEGVSDATTATVVSASVVVLLMDYVITALWGV